ncbi:hypothetical protein BpHYR1_053889 [Brachionus plicatilis]|uniref:Uncharacterized protein n=1 Tax=Brachionus plicatilis TaxID=10195 RepID=A0A3M7T1M6_BRAPC|nr:hypothetical protein BpHYR1_053889 [Brachionus plicatilis]
MAHKERKWEKNNGFGFKTSIYLTGNEIDITIFESNFYSNKINKIDNFYASILLILEYHSIYVKYDASRHVIRNLRFIEKNKDIIFTVFFIKNKRKEQKNTK